jgi:excisionase family DNA binding protein
MSVDAPATTAAQLLTAEQVAERWQVPVSQAYRLAREGRIPSVKLGKYIRFRLADIEAFEADGGTE